MNYIKTFEELWWPFKKESQFEKNKKTLMSLCRWLIDSLFNKKLIGVKIQKVEIGFSPIKDNVLIVQFVGENSTQIRFYWLIDKDLKVVDFDKYYVTESSKVTLHYFKHKVDKDNSDKYNELDSTVNKMRKFFIDNKLM